MAKVEIAQGLLEGQILQSITGDSAYYSFKGIPYATPPLGKLRFKAPQPPQPWKGVRQCFAHGPICYQYDIFSGEYCRTSEDCLYLNVYTPNVKPAKPLPVMVFIHGGGYKSGSGNDDFYGPDFLVEKGVILVTINYRLEVLGFLCLDTEDVPGNAGLKDQAAALYWVKQNISAFGGDPHNVTIFGESAGGASVTYHMISPMSKNLFQRAIPMSGSFLCEWGVTFEPRKRAFALGKSLGKDTKDPEELLHFLQSLPLEKLVNCNPKISFTEHFLSNIDISHFGPVVEKKFTGVESFVNKHPLDMLKQGTINNVDVMIGYTSEEGIIFKGFTKPYDILNEYDDSLLPKEIFLNTPISEGIDIAKKIKQYYFSDADISDKIFQKLASYFSWYAFKFNIQRFLRHLPETQKKYFYQFSAVTERNINGNIFKEICKDLKGVSHLDDLLYLFHQPAAKLNIDKNSKSWNIIQQTCALWTNFAKYGNPTPDASLGINWIPYSSKEETYLDINETLTLGEKLEHDEYLFWKGIYEEAKIFV